MLYSRQIEYNVQQAGKLHNRSGIGDRKQKYLEAGTDNAEVEAEVTCGGTLFQTVAPKTGNARLPIKELVVETMTTPNANHDVQAGIVGQNHVDMIETGH
jgi:hypothetical protein